MPYEASRLVRSEEPLWPAPNLSRGDFAVVLLLVTVWAVMWWATEPLGEFPLNDDWVYAKSVNSILETGDFRLSYSDANAFAQAYWGALFCLPFGFSFLALRISTCVLAAVGISAFYLLLREIGGRRWSALVGALTLATNPLYLQLSDTYMTDVSFIALFSGSLWLYVRGIKHDSWPLLVGAFAAGYVALLIRQFALVLPLAYGVAHVFRKGRSMRALTIAALPLLLGFAIQIVYTHWLAARGRGAGLGAPMSNLIPYQPFVALAIQALKSLLRIAPYIGLFMMPLVASGMLIPRSTRLSHIWQSPKLRLMSIVIALLASGMLFAKGKALPSLGNVLAPWGLGPFTLRDTYILGLNQPHVSAAVTLGWQILTVLSIWVATLIGMVLVRVAVETTFKVRCTGLIALMFAILVPYCAAILLMSLHAEIFDRYLLPLMLPLAVLLVGDSRSDPWPPNIWVRQTVPCLLLMAYAVLSVSAVHDYMAWNRARWLAVASLMGSGITPNEIDGGYEFNGWFLYSPTYRQRDNKSYWWVDDDKYIIASGPIDGYDVVARFNPDWWLGWRKPQVLVLRRFVVPSGEGG